MNKHWVTVRFKLNDYYADERVNDEDSPLHLMIAHEICSPLIEEYKFNIVLWRFHRLYIEKGEGAQNSFRFKIYGDTSLKESLLLKLSENPLVKELKKKRLLQKLEVDFSDGYRIRDDHDVNYPLLMKEIWPYYINGVSIAWLKAIQHHCRFPNLMKADFWTRLDHYAKVIELIEDDWLLYARPAFFHHANALFGYKYTNCLFGKGKVIEKKDRKFLPDLLGKYKYKVNRKPINLLINH